MLSCSTSSGTDRSPATTHAPPPPFEAFLLSLSPATGPVTKTTQPNGCARTSLHARPAGTWRPGSPRLQHMPPPPPQLQGPRRAVQLGAWHPDRLGAHPNRACVKGCCCVAHPTHPRVTAPHRGLLPEPTWWGLSTRAPSMFCGWLPCVLAGRASHPCILETRRDAAHHATLPLLPGHAAMVQRRRHEATALQPHECSMLLLAPLPCQVFRNCRRSVC